MWASVDVELALNKARAHGTDAGAELMSKDLVLFTTDAFKESRNEASIFGPT
jgi:hypothetical protein